MEPPLAAVTRVLGGAKDALHTAKRALDPAAVAMSAPSAPTTSASPATERIALLWEAFQAAEARVRELEARLAAPSPPHGSVPASSPAADASPRWVALERAEAAAQARLEEAKLRIGALERSLAESEGRRHELDRLVAALWSRLDEPSRGVSAEPPARRVPVDLRE